MQKLLEQLRTLGKGKMALLLGGVAVVVSLLVVTLLMSKGPEYQVLYAQLSPEDSGAVIEKLKEKRVPYKVDGTTITVPFDKVHETRMELAGEGLPQGGGIGFEIFDKTSFGVTEFVQKVNYKRALQGELSRTISQIKEIESARVHLALPEKGVFLDEQKKARASVIVKLKPGKTLNQGQVSSIIHLVANSADNLRPEDITVVDTAGKMWTRESDESDALHLSASQLEYKRSLEKDYENRLQSMLERAVGMDKVVARVSVEVDSRHTERTEEKFDPEGQVIRSEHRNKEKSVGGTAALGVPGVLSNLPDAKNAGAGANSTPPQSQKQDEVINYEISKVTSHVVEPIGAIKRLTVSVLVDGTYAATKGADGKEVNKYSARTEEELSKYTDMVKGAVGYSDARGDVITVVSAPFETASFAEAEVEAEKPSMISPQMLPVILKYATIALIAVFIILFIIRPVTRRMNQESNALEEIQKGMPHALAAGSSELALTAGQKEEERIEKLKKVVRDNPQQVAMALKSWIKER